MRSNHSKYGRPAMFEILESRVLFSGGYSISAVARLGDSAPGPAGGQFTFDFELGGINNKGQAIFTADLTASDNTGDVGEGVFLSGKGGIAKLAHVGEAAPGGGTFQGYGTLSPDAINNAGDAAFAFTQDPGGGVGIDSGLYRYDHASGNVNGVVVPGVTHVPGAAPGVNFLGASFRPSLNDRGALAFTGIVPGTIGPGASLGGAAGIYVADRAGNLTALVAPGSAAPGGGIFDYAGAPSMNARGDIVFTGEVQGQPLFAGSPGAFVRLGQLYLRNAATGAIRPIAPLGNSGAAALIPGVDYAMNNRDEVAYLGYPSLSGTLSFADIGDVTLYSHGVTRILAKPGDTMPGGGHYVNASGGDGNIRVNNHGDVAFNALLDDGNEGVYLWSDGSLHLVAKTGQTIPGVGTISNLDFYGVGFPSSFIAANDRGQIAFGASLQGGGGAILVATPGGDDGGEHGQGGDATAIGLPANGGTADSSHKRDDANDVLGRSGGSLF